MRQIRYTDKLQKVVIFNFQNMGKNPKYTFYRENLQGNHSFTCHQTRARGVIACLVWMDGQAYWNYMTGYIST